MIFNLPAQDSKTQTIQKHNSENINSEKLSNETINDEKQAEEVKKQKKSAEKSAENIRKKNDKNKNFEEKVHQRIVRQNKKQNDKKEALRKKNEKKTLKQENSSDFYNSSPAEKNVKTSSTKKIEKSKSPVFSQTYTKKTKSIKKTPAFDSKNQHIEQKQLITNQHEVQKKPRIEKKKIHQGSGYHQPHVVIEHQHITYSSPRFYHYYVPPRYIYRGVWIRYYMDLPNGYVFYNGYPYYVYNNYLHRYSVDDKGYYDLVDSWNDETYATFYGDTIKDSYDRCADLRDRLNAEYGEERYFCSERFEYDPDYKYGWDPDDFPDWYWY